MNEYTVIQRLTPIASFLVTLPYYVYVVWPNRRRITRMFGQTLPQWSAIQRANTLFFSVPSSGKNNEMLGDGNLGRPTGGWKTRSSVAADWLAPLIVWFVVMTMGFAIVGFLLLGER